MDDTPSQFAERLITADVGTWSYDPVADELQADAGFARLLGLSDADAAGGPLAAVLAGIHPDDRERMAEAYAAVVRTRCAFAAQFRTVDRNGRTRVVVGRAHVELDASGRAARLPGILIDVTAQRDAESRAAALIAATAAADARFRAFFEHAGTFAAIAEPDGTVVEASAGAWRGCGFARDAVVGLPLHEGPWWRASPTSRAVVGGAVERARAGGLVRELVSWARADGAARRLELVVRPVRDASGSVTALAASALDVTDRVATERRLRDSEARYRIALDAADLGTWSITPGRELVVDERFASIFAGAPERIDFARAVELVHPEDRARVEAAILRAMRPDDPAPYDEEYRVVHPGSGAVRWIQARGRSRVEDIDGEPRLVSFDGTILDTTERRHMEDELRQLAADLAEADRRKNEFLATLAHELRNPLAPISNALRIVARERGRGGGARGDAARVDAALATLERQSAQMARLVDDLMDVSRISRGRVELERRTVALGDVVDAALEASRPLLEATGHELVVAVPEDPILVEADVTRLSQALLNLLNNAAKYSEPGTRVELDVRRAGDEVEIRVIDRGIGLDADRLDDIFRMFVQVDGSTSRARGGLGIGLALVDRFVALHGGRVDVHSDGPDRGATFRVTLPALPAGTVPPPSDGAPSDKAPSGGTPSDKTAPSSVATAPPRRRVLVVDDNEDGANTWVTVLGLEGHAARAVHDGLSALAAFEDFRPDTVLLDIGMPGMDGHETCRRLRALPGGPAAHVVAITGWGAPADRERSAAAGVDRHLVKPVKARDLLALLDSPPARGPS